MGPPGGRPCFLFDGGCSEYSPFSSAAGKSDPDRWATSTQRRSGRRAAEVGKAAEPMARAAHRSHTVRIGERRKLLGVAIARGAARECVRARRMGIDLDRALRQAL